MYKEEDTRMYKEENKDRIKIQVLDYPVFRNCRLEHCGVRVELFRHVSNLLTLRCWKCFNQWIIEVED